MGKIMIINRCLNGFTLIEVLIAMTILAIALLGLSATSVVVMNSNSLSQMSSKAAVMAKEKVEGLKNLSYGNISSGQDTLETVYTRSWTVTNNSPVTDTKTILVTVSWPWRGNTHSVTLITMISK